MGKPFSRKERRKYPRIFIDLPLNIEIWMAPAYVEQFVVNASEEGFSSNHQRHTCWYELSMTVLYPKGFELANFQSHCEDCVERTLLERRLGKRPILKGYHMG